MSLGAHLVELRKRLMYAALALVVGMVIAFIVADPVIHFITEPIRIITEKRGDDFSALNFGTVTAAFDMRMRIAFSIGIFLSKRAGLAVDRFIVFAGILMIVLTLYVAFVSGPPVGEALYQTVLPATIDF
ncbi:MAG: hypothetical protein E2584_01410, partial [Microbacterium sp.]|nr:hypothetical protein [Microbacterium sp.]